MSNTPPKKVRIHQFGADITPEEYENNRKIAARDEFLSKHFLENYPDLVREYLDVFF